jgi:hypothetical protein
MKKEYIYNKKLNEIFKYETNELMREKIKKAKSFVNIKCPESFSSARQQNLRNQFIKNPCKKIIQLIYFIL